MARSTSSRVDSALDHPFDIKSFYDSCGTDNEHYNFFRDLDKDEVFEQGMEAVANSGNRNFVVDFSDDSAWAGFDLAEAAIMQLVKTGGWPGVTSTRWVNISSPVKQKSLIEKLALHYDFSPRLLAMICSEPPPPKSQASNSHVTHRQSKGDHVPKGSADMEKGPLDSDVDSIHSNNPARSGNIYALLDEVWHYTSVDQARNYLCLGYNSIYPIAPADRPLNSVNSQLRTPLPNCVRVWTWLFLCTDKTVISINEDLFPHRTGALTGWEKHMLLRTKQNTINVFKSLSQADGAALSSMPLLPIRKRLAEGGNSAAELGKDAPGLLFYFLFENWFNSYSLITRRDSRYEKELQDIRTDMFKKPQLGQIDRLDQVGNELGMLKRHYKSYIRIIDRIIENQSGSKPGDMYGSQFSMRISEDDESQPARALIRPSRAETSSILGIDPGISARVRFERLKDMITLYALNEVEDYLEKKKSLVDMNFQLIAIKESQDVDRLTRVSLLITKATILFLPINLMTSYFGATFKNQDFTFQQYWVAFAVILVMSFTMLVGFGVFSGTLERWTFFPTLRKLSAHFGNTGKGIRKRHEC